ncbi:hypothetical protein B0H10DRAFT_2192099 [Mycena sp. CBHHK59/15]|nr:hypothetical protein B0H10DRAFT_2192099 [Mycena sp. CBHHK59/15]
MVYLVTPKTAINVQSLGGLAKSLAPPVIDTAELSVYLLRFFQNSCHLVGTSLLYWDHILTLDSEIRFLWRRTRSPSTWWFFINRYLGLISNIPVVILSFVTLSPKPEYQNISVASWDWSMSGRHLCLDRLWTASLCFKIFWMPYGIDTIHYSAYRLAASWEALFLFDSIIFVFIISHAYTTRRRMGPHANLPLHTVITRDGAIYFGGMALANLSNIGTFYIGGVFSLNYMVQFSSRTADSTVTTGMSKAFHPLLSCK